MKKYLSIFLAILMSFCLIACEKATDQNAAVSGDQSTATSGAQTSDGGNTTLSGDRVLLPSVITYIGSDGTRYDMQTIEMQGTLAQVRFYRNYNGVTTLSSGYDVDIAKINPLEIIRVLPPASDGKTDDGLIRYTFSDEGATIVKESAYRLSQGIGTTENYSITYDSQGRIEKVIITSKYQDQPEDIEERIYQYSDTGYTISYTDSGWSATDDDGTKVLRHMCYEIPFESDNIIITETYRKEDGSVHSPDDFYADSGQKIDKLVYEVNRQGFLVANTLYLKNGHIETNQNFFGGLRFSVEFNDNGMPIKYVTTSKDGSNPYTSTFTYDDNGNLISYREESDNVNFTVELQWSEYPAEVNQIFAAAFNFSHFSIREVIEDNCPEILLGPQELNYSKDLLLN